MIARCVGRGTVAALVLALTLAALPRVAPAQVQAVDDEARLLLARAETALRAGDRRGARLFLARLAETVGERTEFSDLGRPVVLRGLALYAEILWETGERQEADAILDRIVAIDPRFDMPEVVPEALAERFADRRERRVGFLRIGLFPADAEVLVDGEVVDPVPDLLPVLAGEHFVVARRPGYASDRQEVVVRANRTEGVGFTLERSSATLRIATSPSGATVVVDGDVIGRTAAAGSETSESEPLVIEGLLPGWHDLEVTLADHRPFRQRIEVPQLSDYDLGTLVLERSLGVVLLRGLPAGATVRVDGEPVDPEQQTGGDGRPLASGAARLALPVGDHRIEVAAPGGVYEARVVVGDGDSVGLDVRVRPGLALLGIDGGEELDRQAVAAELGSALDGLDAWFVLERPELPAGASPATTDDDWLRFRQRIAREVPEAALFLHAVLPEGRRADHYVVRIWAPEPGPDHVLEIRVPLGEPEGATGVLEALTPALPRPAPWLGATLIDSLLEEGPLVIDVHAGGPAAQAGIAVGDRVLTADGVAVSTAGEVRDRIDAAQPFAALALDVVRGGSRRAVRVTLGTGPRLPQLGPAVAVPVIWAAAGAELAARGTRVPAWTLELTRARLLLTAGDAAGAAELLDGVRVAEGEPFGQAAVDYWLGVALSSGPSPDLDAARAVLERAAEAEDGRLEHNDGPRVAIRARARLAALEAEDG